MTIEDEGDKVCPCNLLSMCNEDLQNYYVATDKYLKQVHLPVDALTCQDCQCDPFEHKTSLTVLY